MGFQHQVTGTHYSVQISMPESAIPHTSPISVVRAPADPTTNYDGSNSRARTKSTDDDVTIEVSLLINSVNLLISCTSLSDLATLSD